MIKILIIILFFLKFIIPSYSSTKQDIINKLQKIDNLIFDFRQTIEEKVEEGSCIIKYPKKIYCQYNNRNKKIMVSNGKSLVIKNQRMNSSYIYPLKKTPLEAILDKKYLVNEFKKLELRTVNEKYLNFLLVNNNNKINIFFDKKTLNLVGWQTIDIYQNLVIFFISNVEFNKNIDEKLFKLPQLN